MSIRSSSSFAAASFPFLLLHQFLSVEESSRLAILLGFLPLFSLLPALRCFSRRSSSVCLFNPSSFCWWRKDEAHLQGPSIFAFLPPYDISLTLNLSCLQDLKQQKFTIDAEPSETVSFDVL